MWYGVPHVAQTRRPATRAHELLNRDLDRDHPLDLLAAGREGRVQGLRLRDGAREAIEDRAARRGRLRQLVHEHLDRDVVRYQVAALHVGAGLLAELSAVAQRLAEQVARGDVRQAQLLAEGRRLGPLPRADRADQQEDPPPGGRRLVAAAPIRHRMKPS